MKFTSRFNLELVWAELACGSPCAGMWRLTSSRGEHYVGSNGDLLVDVAPAGQWLMVELSGMEGALQLTSAMRLPVEVCRDDIEQQYLWLVGEQQAILWDIWGMLAYLPDVALQRFYLAVLRDERIMRPFFTGKASHQYHHNHVGGLLEHSHEVAITASALCMQHQVGQLSTIVAFIGGLLHDIGKIHLYYNNQDGQGILGQHESFNFMVLAEPLARLSREAPKLFEAIGACLSIKVGRPSEAYLPAQMVHICDRLSMDVHNWRRAFSEVPSYYWFVKSSHGDQVYKRLG
ncbi:HD domain-containing protein [Aeromonas media]|uniref:HD domain-containing protein n=1 Tax=Aeromonas media TaxID=651 RepID=UPI0022808292|nr:HD domain-containing protein [Aeromonas media]MCY9824118.1 TraI domain-containing protein [Aeromonas media]